MPGREQEAVMSALSITNAAPSERRLTGGILFLSLRSARSPPTLSFLPFRGLAPALALPLRNLA
jgi:hypothetical protein